MSSRANALLSMSPWPPRVEIQLNGAQHANTFASFFHRGVYGGNFGSLFAQLFFVDAACDFQPLGMIGDRDVLVAPFIGGFSHFHDGSGAVTPLRVHLQIALEFAQPGRLFCNGRLSLDKGQESAPNFGRRWCDGRVFDPTVDYFFKVGSDTR